LEGNLGGRGKEILTTAARRGKKHLQKSEGGTGYGGVQGEFENRRTRTVRRRELRRGA